MSADAAPGEVSATGRSHRLVLLCILIFAGALRAFGPQERTLWLDELWTMELSSGRGSVHLQLPTNTIIASPPQTTSLADAPPWYRVWTSMESATHPPLYFVALRLWRELAGEGDLPARMFSLLMSLGSLLLLFDTARRLQGPGVALWAAALMAIAPHEVEYGQQVRNYAMLTLLALGALNALVRIETRGACARRLAALGLCLLGMMLTHYFALGAIAAILAYSLLRLPRRDMLAALVVTAASSVAFGALWGPFLLEHIARFGQEDPTTLFLVREESGVLWPLRMTAMAPLRLLMDIPQGASWQALAALVGGALGLTIGLLLARGRRDLLAWILWIAGTIGFVAALDLMRSTRQLEFPRYFLVAGAGVYVLFPAAGQKLRAPLRHVLPALAAMGALATLPRVFHDFTADWPGVIAAMEMQAQAEEIFVIASPGRPPWMNGYLYMSYSHYARQPLRRVAVLAEEPDPALLEDLRHAPGVWLILGNKEVPPLAILPGYHARGGPIGESGFSVWQMLPAD